MDGQSRLTVNLPMWPPRGLNFCHVGYHVGPTYNKKTIHSPLSLSLLNSPTLFPQHSRDVEGVVDGEVVFFEVAAAVLGGGGEAVWK